MVPNMLTCTMVQLANELHCPKSFENMFPLIYSKKRNLPLMDCTIDKIIVQKQTMRKWIQFQMRTTLWDLTWTHAKTQWYVDWNVKALKILTIQKRCKIRENNSKVNHYSKCTASLCILLKHFPYDLEYYRFYMNHTVYKCTLKRQPTRILSIGDQCNCWIQ